MNERIVNCNFPQKGYEYEKTENLFCKNFVPHQVNKLDCGYYINYLLYNEKLLLKTFFSETQKNNLIGKMSKI